MQRTSRAQTSPRPGVRSAAGAGRMLLTLAFAAFPFMPLFPQGLQEKQEAFVSGGKKIGVEFFRPEGAAGRLPAVVMLHGARGIDVGDASIRRLATLLAASGFSTFLVHYFDRTGTGYADDALIRQNFETWLATIRDAVDFVAKQPGVDPEKIGCFGFSLGGYFALALAAGDSRIGAVVELSGGVDASYAGKFQRLPPVLILHGSADRRVPVSNAREIERLAQKFHAPHEVKIYEGEGHYLSQMSILDAVSRGLAFFQKYLR